jgi:hypothetical protein
LRASTGRFRVNSNGERHDLWLLYRCPACGDTAKRRLVGRRRESELPAGALAPYLHDDPAWARRHAFELPPRAAAGELVVRVAQPEPSGERWDRFLARELGLSRGAVARAAAQGRLRLAGAASLARAVQDGQGFALELPGSAILRPCPGSGSPSS